MSGALAPPSLVFRRRSTMETLDAQPEVANRAEVERLLTERLFHAGIPATTYAAAGVWVLPDGTVDSLRTEPYQDGYRSFGAAAAPVLAMLRFKPLTRDGVAVSALVWVEMEFDRPRPALRR